MSGKSRVLEAPFVRMLRMRSANLKSETCWKVRVLLLLKFRSKLELTFQLCIKEGWVFLFSKEKSENFIGTEILK